MHLRTIGAENKQKNNLILDLGSPSHLFSYSAGPTQHFSDGIGMHFLFMIGEAIVKRFFGIYNFSA
jgi:hypothetical protein